MRHTYGILSIAQRHPVMLSHMTSHVTDEQVAYAEYLLTDSILKNATLEVKT